MKSLLNLNKLTNWKGAILLKNQQLPSEQIPILAEVDVAVIGGTFAGLASALQLANQGKRVMIVESRTYLGSEITAALCPWIRTSERRSSKLIQTCIESCGKTVTFGNFDWTIFHLDRLKRKLEDELLEAGVQLLYASLPIGLTSSHENRNGIVIANKSGRQLIECTGIVDATETAVTTFLSGSQSRRQVKIKRHTNVY